MSVGRSKKRKFAIITNDDSFKPPSELSNAVRPRERSEEIEFTVCEY